MSEKSDKLRAMLEKEKERRIKLNNRIEILERRIGDNTDSKASDLKRPLAFLFTMNLKGGTLCQAKPKNISPLPSARRTA